MFFRLIGLVDWASYWDKKYIFSTFVMKILFFKVVLQYATDVKYNKRYDKRVSGQTEAATTGFHLLYEHYYIFFV